MSRRIVLSFVVWAAALAAQVQLKFPPGVYGFEQRYPIVVALPGGGQVMIGSRTENLTAGFLYASGATHQQIAFATLGTPGFHGTARIGGNGNDVPAAAAVDASGNLWIVGSTDSDDFRLVNPIVSEKVPYRTAGFVIELDPTGDNVLFSTYLCGKQTVPAPPFPAPFYGSASSAIAIDQTGSVYVGGRTDESDFPTTPGAYLSGKGGASGFGDTFYYSYLVKISPVGKLIYATELRTGAPACYGGSGCIGKQSTSADVTAVFVDSTGAAAVAGPLGGSLSWGGGYVLKVAADGAKLLWSTTLDVGHGWITNLKAAGEGQSGAVDLFGTWADSEYSPGYSIPSVLGTPGLFAARLKADGSGFEYLRDFGPAVDSNAAGVAVDPAGNAWIAGTSSASSLAGTPNLGTDFVAALNPAGNVVRGPWRLPRGTVAAAPVLDASASKATLEIPGERNALLSFPVDYASDSLAVVAFANPASFDLNTGIWPGALLTLFGYNLPDSPQVLINSVPATVLYAGPSQINLQVPFEAPRSPYGLIPLEVGGRLGMLSVEVPVSRSVGIFTTDGVYAAALNQDGTVNSAEHPAPAGSIVSLFGTGTIWPAGIEDGTAAPAAIPLDQGLNNLIVLDSRQSPLTIFYLGTAPGLINGVFQVNVQLWPAAPDSPLTLRLHNTSTSEDSNPVRLYVK